MRKCPSPTGFFKVDNSFGELMTEAQKSIARRNLGIADEQSLIWENIKGKIGNNRELKKFVENVSEEKTRQSVSHLLDISPETIDLLKYITQWMTESEDVSQLLLDVSTNKEDMKNIKNSKVYITEEEYQNLLEQDLIEDDVEYNVYEE